MLFASEEDLEAAKERLEQESRQWAGLAAVDPLEAQQFSGEIDPWRIDAELKGLVERRSRWDEVFGHVAMLFSIEPCTSSPSACRAITRAFSAFRAARAAAKRWLSAGECLVALAEHFIETWREQLKQANTLQRRIRARDKHFCRVPGCSRAAVHAHHIKPRSQGGSDDPSNLISLRAAHHLHGIHGGRMRVTGSAPDELVWEFGLWRSYVAAA